MKMALIGAILMLTAGCGAYDFPGGDQPGAGTVTGTVEVVGCGPVPVSAGICAPSRPGSNVELDFNRDGTVTAAITNSNGDYSIQLPPATYKVSVKPPLILVSGPAQVTVASGAASIANYAVSSDLRAPLPQQ